ncbi:MAG: hypothetical protein K2M64_03110 [Clostridia bacterium]|nr:hypothetical protein [Clostridia bacterium]
MTLDEYIVAIERVKEMHAKTGEVLGWILGNLKGDAVTLNKVKKMPRQQLR